MTSPSDGDSLATLLRRHRAEAGLTQEELAERAGTSSRTVSDIERGLRGAIYRYTAARLAEALELSAEERSRFQAAARARRPADLRPPRQPGPGEGSFGRAMLPSPLTPLIAREKEISTALQTLRAGARLLTLTGPGGIGKTRVALEVMARGQEDFEHGVFLASLAANPDPALVPAIVASVLGAPAEREPLVPTIAQHVGERRVLLACDTFEHVLDAAPLIADLLASCPRLAVLVTSRTPLRLQGEQEMSIPPLALPSLEVVDAFDVTRFSAVTLFIQRAQAVRSELPVDEATLPLIADICRRLEGIPLALELAAARVKHLPLPALAANLEHRLSVLTGGPRDVPERHQAMRDTIAWSYELLTPRPAAHGSPVAVLAASRRPRRG